MTMIDVIIEDEICKGIVASKDGKELKITAQNTILATGGIGGRYKHSTNYPHLTGDAIEIAKKHGIRLENLDYVQIHPTTLYSTKPGRRFLISESVRGEGAVLYNQNKERFIDELLPRDIVSKAIYKEMEKEQTEYVWLSMENIKKDDILIGNIRPYLRKIWFANNDGGTNGDVLDIRVKDIDVIYPKYLYYILSSENFFEYDNSNSKGAKMPRGDKEAVMNFRFNLPKKEVQIRIIEFLDNINQLINSDECGLNRELDLRILQQKYYSTLIFNEELSVSE